jgi:hypothetical protein
MEFGEFLTVSEDASSNADKQEQGDAHVAVDQKVIGIHRQASAFLKATGVPCHQIHRSSKNSWREQ